MSVTVVNDWRFLEDADLQEGMSAIRQYMSYLAEDESELEQSLWIQVQGSPLRYFHIATYASLEALERQKGSKGTQRFVERLYPLIDRDSLAQPFGEVVANVGNGPGKVQL